MTKNQLNEFTKEQEKKQIEPKSTLWGVQPQIQNIKDNEQEEKDSQISDRSTDGKSKNHVPNFIYHNGPIINNPQVYMLFVGDWNSVKNQNRATRLVQFMKDLLQSPYMNILSQYGCGNTGKVFDSIFIDDTDKDLSTDDIKNIIQKS